MDIQIDLAIVATVMLLTALVASILRDGFAGAAYGARIVRKLGRTACLPDAEDGKAGSGQVEIVELESHDGKTRVGLALSRSGRSSRGFGRWYNRAWRSMSKDEALEFARFLRETAKGGK